MLQILTPLNKGKNLVQGAISQSGNLIDQSGLMKINRRNITLEFAKSLGCKTNKVLLHMIAIFKRDTLINQSHRFSQKSNKFSERDGLFEDESRFDDDDPKKFKVSKLALATCH